MKNNTKFRHLKKYILIFCFLILFISCGTKQDVVYFQGVDNVGSSVAINNYTPTIRTDDMLTITVSALDQDAARPFNLPMVAFSGDGADIGRATQQSFLVDTNGNIDFPVLGTVKLAGLSRIQATELIKDMLIDYIKNPIVIVRIINYKITVLGEVSRPGSFTIPNERITILEALSQAGDVTINAERKNVLVIREQGEKKTYQRVDLTSETVFNSPVYYLKQNDVIYVEPNNSKIKSSSVGPSSSETLRVISLLLTSIALVVSITRL